MLTNPGPPKDKANALQLSAIVECRANALHSTMSAWDECFGF